MVPELLTIKVEKTRLNGSYWNHRLCFCLYHVKSIFRVFSEVACRSQGVDWQHKVEDILAKFELLSAMYPSHCTSYSWIFSVSLKNVLISFGYLSIWEISSKFFHSAYFSFLIHSCPLSSSLCLGIFVLFCICVLSL